MENKLLGRLRDGSEYWVEKDWRNRYAEYRKRAAVVLERLRQSEKASV